MAVQKSKFIDQKYEKDPLIFFHDLKTPQSHLHYNEARL